VLVENFDGLITPAHPFSIMPASTAGNPAITLPRSLRLNRNSHPGVPDKPKPKRSTLEVQAEKTAKEKARLEKEEKRSEDIAKTALLEEKTRQEYEEKMMNAHHPPENLQQKVLRPRKEPQPVNKFPGMR
jgi:hypothetical protein